MSRKQIMEIKVNASMANLCVPVRNELEATGISHLACLNACNSHLGKMKGEVKGDDKRSDGKYNVKRDSFKMSVQPGRVEFKTTADIVGQFIAWHDAIEKAHKLATMERVAIPSQFSEWISKFTPKAEVAA